MTIDEVWQRAVTLMERMRELEQECHLLEQRHGEVVTKMREVTDAMEGLLRQALDSDGEQELW